MPLRRRNQPAMVPATVADRARDASGDAADLRDRPYQPSLVEIPAQLLPDPADLKIRDQGTDGACVGFALAAAIDFQNRRRGTGSNGPVSTRMLYTLAQQFDEWPGEDYSGSSVRGGLRGWWQMGVCPEADWRYRRRIRRHVITVERARKAKHNMLGAYYRLQNEVSDYHAALNEVGVVVVSARVHTGWDSPVDTGAPLPVIGSGLPLSGAHAVALVGYTAEGFVVQNSWGSGWGQGGLAIWRYDDWQEHVRDAWVFRLAAPAPAMFDHRFAAHSGSSERSRRAVRRGDVAGHYLHLRSGGFADRGPFASTADDLTITLEHLQTRRERYNRILLICHSAVTPRKQTMRCIAQTTRTYKDNGIYPLHLVSDQQLGRDLIDLLSLQVERVLQRTGNASAPAHLVERAFADSGRRMWSELAANAQLAAADDAPLGLLVAQLQAALQGTSLDVAVAAHNDGALPAGHLLARMAGNKGWRRRVAAVTLLGPACSTPFMANVVRKAFKRAAAVDAPLQLVTLPEASESADRLVEGYPGSWLELVARCLQSDPTAPLAGLAGSAPRLKDLGVSVSEAGRGRRALSLATRHQDFLVDPRTLNTLIASGGGQILHPFPES